MTSDTGDEKEESEPRTPSNQVITSGKATPTKGPASGNISRDESFVNQSDNLSPGTGRLSAAISESQIHSEAEEEPPPPPVKKEPNVIVDASLNLLAVHIVQKRFLLAMYLNVPTAALVTTDTEVREQQQAHKRPPTLDQLREQLQRQIARKEPLEHAELLSPEGMEQEVAFRLLKHWRSLKGNAKDKDKVMELVRALKMIDRTDLGDIIVSQNKATRELTPAVLPVLKAQSSTAPAKAKKVKSATKK